MRMDETLLRKLGLERVVVNCASPGAFDAAIQSLGISGDPWDHLAPVGVEGQGGECVTMIYGPEAKRVTYFESVAV